MNGKDKLLIGGVYKSPNCDAANHELLNRLIKQAVGVKYKNSVIIGDFNFPDIVWDTLTVNTSETRPAFHFIENLRDNILSQHISSNTRFRDGQDSSCLDLLLTDKKELIENIKIGDKLGASDHASIIFDVLCDFQPEQQRPNFYKADYTVKATTVNRQIHVVGLSV